MRFGLALLFLGFTPLFAQSTQIAGLQQDLAEIRTEVEKLKLENADLKEALARVKANNGGQSAAQADAVSRSRIEGLNEVDRRLKQQTADVNAALAELTRQVNVALGKNNTPSNVKPAPVAKVSAKTEIAPAASDDSFPADMPRAGIKYRVKSGDTVAKIARLHGSKVEWILLANKMSSPAALRADVEIFVPQPEPVAR